jgi:hypothetical protein
VADTKQGYYQRLLRDAGFGRKRLKIRSIIGLAVQAPTAARIRAAGVILFYCREVLVPSDEVLLELLDFTAIMQVEREWLPA